MQTTTAAQKPKKTLQELFDDFIKTQDAARDALAMLISAKSRADYDRLLAIRTEKERAYRYAFTAYMIARRESLPE